jgi:hypothetical protein
MQSLTVIPRLPSVSSSVSRGFEPASAHKEIRTGCAPIDIGFMRTIHAEDIVTQRQLTSGKNMRILPRLFSIFRHFVWGIGMPPCRAAEQLLGLAVL